MRNTARLTQSNANNNKTPPQHGSTVIARYAWEEIFSGDQEAEGRTPAIDFSSKN
jgi:hypothetical protein